MVLDDFDKCLEEQGFIRLGEINHRFALQIWWHRRDKIQLVISPGRESLLIRGDKSYHLQSISSEGQTWARQIGPLHDYLQNHFDTLHLSFTFARDVTGKLAQKQANLKLATGQGSMTPPDPESLSSLQEESNRTKQHINSLTYWSAFDEGDDPFLNSYAKKQIKGLQKNDRMLRQQIKDEQQRHSLLDQMSHAYQRDGSASCLTFAIGSNLQNVSTLEQFGDAVQAIRKELTDLHRYQITQKLNGGRLNIQISEATDPALVWMEHLLGGSPTPRELERLGDEFEPLRESVSQQTMVTADEDIQVAGTVHEEKKCLAAHVVSSLVKRLHRTETLQSLLENCPRQLRPASVGLMMTGKKLTSKKVELPLEKLQHVYLSGATGSGKSFAGHVLIEEAAGYRDANILVVDPRNQAAGLLVPEDREDILDAYKSFGMKSSDARGFDFEYVAPGMQIGKSLPQDLSQLGQGRKVVSFKGLDDRQRCQWIGQILKAVLADYAREESNRLRLILYVDEAHLLTKRRVDEQAKDAASQAEMALDRLVREGRKYGVCVVIASQTIKDFAYDSASIRQNTNTKIFLRNADREVEYASDFIERGRDIIDLGVGEAFVHNAAWGVVKVRFRPPFSKVWDFGEEATRQIIHAEHRESVAVSVPAKSLFDVICKLTAGSNEGPHLSTLSEAAGLTSKRKLLNLVEELERAGWIITQTLNQRGNPRIVTPILPEIRADETPDGSRTKRDETL